MNENEKTYLQKRREQLNLSVTELSEISGVSAYTIHSYEQKRRNITAASTDKIVALSQALQCKPDDILERR